MNAIRSAFQEAHGPACARARRIPSVLATRFGVGSGLLVLVLVLLLVDGGTRAQAREGYVRLRSGTIYEGHVRFDSNAVIVVSAARGVWERVPFAEVAAIGLTPLASDRVRGRMLVDGPLTSNAGWRSADIGAVGEAGQVEVRSGGLWLRTAGTNVLGREDSLHYVYRTMEGSGQWLGRVLDTENRLTGTKVGFVIREHLSSGARQVVLVAGGAEGGESGEGEAVFFGARGVPGDPVGLLAERAVHLPRWIKLARSGSQFSAFVSGDGRRWSLLGRVRLSLPDEVLAGVGAVGGVGGGSGVAQLDHFWTGREAGNAWFTPQVWLVGGSVRVGAIERVDDSSIRFGAGLGPSLATRAVANIRFRPVPQKVARALNTGRPGVFLNSGEFVEGDIRGVQGGQVSISSVPLGLLHYDAGAEVMAVVFRRPGTTGRLPCRLTTVDGSVWLAASMSIDGDWVVVREASFGVRRVPLYEVVELLWGRAA